LSQVFLPMYLQVQLLCHGLFKLLCELSPDHILFKVVITMDKLLYQFFLHKEPFSYLVSFDQSKQEFFEEHHLLALEVLPPPELDHSDLPH